jgi:L-ascorbate metabolism protein UlaG (beta-lactamase superfamily)
MKDMDIDYAMLCTDGYYNMGPEEAVKAAELIMPAHVIPIHTSRDKEYDQANADAFVSDLKIDMKPGDMIRLSRKD